MKILIYLTFFILFFSCNKDDLIETSSHLYLGRGDIVVTSNTADDALSISSNGLTSKFLTNLDRTSEKVSAAGWMSTTDNLLLAIDGRDRIISVSPISGVKEDIISNTQLNGTLRCVTQIQNGDIIVCETNNLERFNSRGVRITSGWPIAVNTPYGIEPLSNGGFILCAGGSTDQVRIYDNDGTVVSSHAGPGGHDAIACKVLNDRRIVVAWSGGSDQVWIYEPDLSNGQVLALNSDITLMPSPTGITQLKNGNIGISDYTYHHIVEIDLNGEFVRTFGILHDPLNIFSIPLR